MTAIGTVSGIVKQQSWAWAGPGAHRRCLPGDAGILWRCLATVVLSDRNRQAVGSADPFFESVSTPGYPFIERCNNGILSSVWLVDRVAPNIRIQGLCVFTVSLKRSSQPPHARTPPGALVGHHADGAPQANNSLGGFVLIKERPPSYLYVAHQDGDRVVRETPVGISSISF